mgnify:CR=1 FL=1|jgi:hypothetical protein
MKFYVAKCNEYNLVYVYTNKKAMMKDCNKYDFEVQEPIEFKQTQIASVLGAMAELSSYCGNTIDYKIGK